MKKLVVVLALTFSTLAWGNSAYVTDQFKITMRSGESATHRITRMLPSGTRLDVIAANPQTGYSKVRTEGGVEGYVLTRQLIDQPVARDQLADLQAEVDALKAAPGELQSRLATLTEQHRQLKSTFNTLKSDKQIVDQELAALQRTSANAVRISNERNELRKQVAKLTRDTEDLKQQNRELENNSAQSWFLIGAGVVAGGILLGLILPNLRIRKRKDSWGSL